MKNKRRAELAKLDKEGSPCGRMVEVRGKISSKPSKESFAAIDEERRVLAEAGRQLAVAERECLRAERDISLAILGYPPEDRTSYDKRYPLSTLELRRRAEDKLGGVL